MSKNKSIELNSAKIINIRKNLDMTINKYWKIIRAENVMAKKAIAAGQGSGYDLKGLYNEITQMSEKRIIIKGMLMLLNMGITEFNYEEFKKTNNYAIFLLRRHLRVRSIWVRQSLLPQQRLHLSLRRAS